MSTLIQILLVMSFFSFALYNYLDNLNDLTRMRLDVPQVQQHLHQQITEYQQLRDEWARMTNAASLYELAEKHGFRHLRIYKTPQPLPENESTP